MLDSSAVIVPGEGHIYVDISGSAAAPTGTGVPSYPWVEVGHTSRDEPLSISREGGERTTLGSWQNSALRETVSATTYALAFKLLQHDELGLKLYYGGGSINSTSGGFRVPKVPAAQEYPIFVRVVDGSAVWAEYFPNASILGSDSAETDPENLSELPVSATILGEDALDYLFEIRRPAAAPTVSLVSPATGAAAGGNTVTIYGGGFTGVTDVEFDDVNATSFTIESDSQISAVVPAGVAGLANVDVTNATGTGTLTDGYTYS